MPPKENTCQRQKILACVWMQHVIWKRQDTGRALVATDPHHQHCNTPCAPRAGMRIPAHGHRASPPVSRMSGIVRGRSGASGACAPVRHLHGTRGGNIQMGCLSCALCRRDAVLRRHHGHGTAPWRAQPGQGRTLHAFAPPGHAGRHRPVP
nr:hypothetical protein RVX_2436 [Nitratidesulfovibrio sp. HK-II]